MKNFTTALTMAATGLLLASCGTPPEPREMTATETVTHTITPTTTSLSKPTTTSTEEAPGTTPSGEPAQQAANSEPYVVECLEGTPGPALWSDGSTRYSDSCFQSRGGDAYLEQEAQSGMQLGGTAVNGYGYAPNGARNPSSGEIQTYHGCQDGYITDPDLCAGAENVVRAADPNGDLYG